MVSVHNEDRYEYEHGKKPRGRGFWAFKFGNEKRLRWYPPLTSGKYAMMYSDAKKSAIKDAKKKGYNSISLMP